MARRSARLSSRKSSTPQPIKRVSLSHDATGRTPRTVPSKLASLHENDEMPGSFPDSPTASPPHGQLKRMKTVASTPERAKPVVPANEDMHPQLHHQTTTKSHEDARWLGFSAMSPHTEKSKHNNTLAIAQATPSRSTQTTHAFQSPTFQFTFHREQSLELSPAAKKLMGEKRAEAARIKEQMRADGEASATTDTDLLARRLATPKSQRGRFSGAHNAQFEKMDSIAKHASAYRKTPDSRPASSTEHKIATGAKSLKRSPSKAELDKLETTPSKAVGSLPPKSAKSVASSALPRFTSHPSVASSTAERNDISPSKRIKRTEADDSSSNRPKSSGTDSSQPSTPRDAVRVTTSYPNLDHLTTPTQSSLARAASLKSAKTSKIPAPALARSPSKPDLTRQPGDQDTKTSTPLLAKSPAKAGIFGPVSTVKTGGMLSPLLSRTPVKLGGKASNETDKDVSSAAKPHIQPLLSRTPLKMAMTKPKESNASDSHSSHIPFFSRTPAKAPSGNNPFDSTQTSQTTAKSAQSSLLGRLNLLRASPIKSILRTPQRLYSDDPAKVAAGTHLATPPKFAVDKAAKGVPATAPVRKHVDFTSSTKDREASKEASLSPSYIASHSDPKPSTPSTEPAKTVSVKYPDLQVARLDVAPSVQGGHTIAAPSDFTFRIGNEIKFAPSPSPTRVSASPLSKSPSTIRYVSAEPDHDTIIGRGIHATGSKKHKIEFEDALSARQTEPSPTVTPGRKKRKFDWENNFAEQQAENYLPVDKENVPEDAGADDGNDARPSKRLKANSSSASPARGTSTAPKRLGGLEKTVIKQRTTLGVKPKSAIGKAPDKKERKSTTSTISMARLNALAMPKKRG